MIGQGVEQQEDTPILPAASLIEALRHLYAVFTQPHYQAAARQHARGKLTVEEKVALLFDPKTFVEEPVPAPDLEARHGERRLLTGYGDVQERRVAVAIFNSAIAAGSVTISTGKKLIRHMQQAEAQRCPLLIDWDSGGADINDGVASLDIFRQIFTQIYAISGRIPTLSIISGLNAGGGAYAPVMTDTVIMIDGSMMAVTGPQVIKVATGEDVTPEAMGGAQLHSEQSGEAHYRVSTYEEAAHLARRYFSYLPQSMWSFPPSAPLQEKAGVPIPLRAIITQARHNARLKKNASWDVRTFIEAAVDDQSWLEYHEKFGTVCGRRICPYCGHCRGDHCQPTPGPRGIDDRRVIVQSHPFSQLANAYHLPVITLVDVPGFIATQAESSGQILSKGAALLMMYPHVMVPRVSVVIDKAFGGAYCAMDSITTSLHPRLCRYYGFTTGQIAVMGKEAGPFFTYGAEGGDAVSKEHNQERYETEYLNMDLAFAGHFVTPLEPEHLRQCLVEQVTALFTAYQTYWQTLSKNWTSFVNNAHSSLPSSAPVLCAVLFIHSNPE